MRECRVGGRKWVQTQNKRSAYRFYALRKTLKIHCAFPFNVRSVINYECCAIFFISNFLKAEFSSACTLRFGFFFCISIRIMCGMPTKVCTPDMILKVRRSIIITLLALVWFVSV